MDQEETHKQPAPSPAQSPHPPELLASVIERMSDGFVALDKEWRFIYVNQHAALVLNREKPQDLIGKHIWLECPDFVGQPSQQAYQRAMETQTVVNLEAYDERLDCWFENRIYPSPDRLTIYITEVTARKRAESALHDTEERLRLAVRAAYIGLWDWDLKSNKVYFSPEWKRQIGYEDDEISNDFDEWQSRVHPDDLEAALDTVQQFLANPYPNYRNEFRFRHKDGTYRWILAQADLLYNEHGEPVRMLGAHVDISEQKRTEAALSESEQRFSRIFHSSPVATVLTRAVDSQFANVNKAMETLTGYSRDELLGKTSLELDLVVSPQTRSRLAQETRHSGGYREVQTQIRRKTGEIRDVLLSSDLLEIDGEAFVITMAHDISERRRAEQAVREREQQLASIYDAVGDAIYYLSVEEGGNYRFASVNQAFVATTGLQADQVIGKRVNEITPEPSLTLVLGKYEEAIREKKLVRWEETSDYPARTWAGDVTVSPIFDEDGHCAHLVGSVHDITERSRSEAQIRKLSRAHRVISRINREIVKMQDVHDLLEAACSIAIEDGAFQMAWVGIVDNETGQVNPVAWAGAENGYLEKLQIALGDGRRGQGPTAQSLLQGVPIVSNDIASDPNMLPWRDEGLKRGYRASAAFPLNLYGEVRGSLTLYSDKAGFFDEDELELLDELAQDISFAMQYAESQQQRQRAQEALESSESRFRTLIEKSSDSIILIDATGKTIYASPSIERALGYRPEEFIQLDRMALVHPDDVINLMSQLKIVFAQPGELVEGEHRVRHKDGSWRTFHRMVRNLLHDPAVNAIVSNLADITERKQTEEELRASEELFSSAFHVGPAGMTITRIADGKFLDANSAFCSMFEFNRDEVIGHKSTELNMWTPEERRRLIEQQLATGGLHDFELVARSKSGRQINVLFSSKEVQINGEACHLTTLVDITKRKQVEDSLRASEERYRRLIEHASDGIFVADQLGRYVDVNTSGCTMLGYTHEELVGKQLGDLIATEDLAAQPLKTDQIKAGKSLISERLLKRKDGTFISVEISGTRLPDGHLLGIVRDITERKRAEQAQRESEQRYQFLFENMLNGFAYCRMYFEQDIPQDFVYLEVNSAFEQQTGLKNVVGKRVSEIIPGITESDTELLDICGRVALTGVPERFEIFIAALDMWFAISAYSPQREFFVAVFDVVTERKRAEQALQIREERFRLAMQNIPDVVVIYDPDLRMQFINDATTEITGRPVSDFVGRRDDEVWPPEIYEGYLPSLAEARETRSTKSVEVNLTLPNGVARNLVITCVPVLNADGTVREILGVTHDFTERKRAEESLQRYNQRLTVLREIDRSIVAARTPDTIAVAVLHGIRQLIPCERASVALFDESTEEASVLAATAGSESHVLEKVRVSLKGDPRTEILKAGRPALVQDMTKRQSSTSALWDQLVEEGFRSSLVCPMVMQGIFIGSLNLVSKTPDFFTSEYQEIAVEVANQLAIALHQARLHEQLERSNLELEARVAERTAQLEAKNRQLETYTYTVSHDLKAPLRGIDGYSRLLLEDYQDRLDDDGRSFLQNVRIATDQMNQLIDDLLAYSRLERRPLQFNKIDLRMLVDTIVAERAADIQSRPVKLTVDGPNVSVSADYDGLALSLRNLLDNALKFTGHTGQPTVEIIVRETEDVCTVSVRDNGMGFDMKYHDRILEIFQRLHRAEEYPGTGIGLAIVQKAMERMKGRVWAESEPGKGAVFYLEIPK